MTTPGFRDVLRDRPRQPAGHVQPALPQAGAVRAAAAALRGARARSTADGAVVAPLDRRRRSTPIADRCAARRRRGDRGLLPPLLRQPGARARAPATGSRRGCPDVAITVSSRHHARVARVRAHEHRGAQRLRAAGRGPLPRAISRSAPRARGLRARAVRHAVERRARRRSRARGGTPINLVESGPAGGDHRRRADRRGRSASRNVIYLDIGGTTAKCSLIEDGQPADHDRLPARVDAAERRATRRRSRWSTSSRSAPAAARSPGSTRPAGCTSGPRSAGAEPGPACYGKGGTEPTVTDAKLRRRRARPRLLPRRAAAGRAASCAAAGARRGSARRSAPRRRRPPTASSGSPTRSMINALKLVSVRRGHDPRDFVLVACGGGGPMHAAALGAELRVKRIVIPPLAGRRSRPGACSSPSRAIDLMRTHILRTDGTDLPTIWRRSTRRWRRRPARASRRRRAAAGRARASRARWRCATPGQEHTVSVPLDDERPPTSPTSSERFHARARAALHVRARRHAGRDRHLPPRRAPRRGRRRRSRGSTATGARRAGRAQAATGASTSTPTACTRAPSTSATGCRRASPPRARDRRGAHVDDARAPGPARHGRRVGQPAHRRGAAADARAALRAAARARAAERRSRGDLRDGVERRPASSEPISSISSLRMVSGGDTAIALAERAGQHALLARLAVEDRRERGRLELDGGHQADAGAHLGDERVVLERPQGGVELALELARRAGRGPRARGCRGWRGRRRARRVPGVGGAVAQQRGPARSRTARRPATRRRRRRAAGSRCVTPLANVIRSGSTPQRSMPNQCRAGRSRRSPSRR